MADTPDLSAQSLLRLLGTGARGVTGLASLFPNLFQGVGDSISSITGPLGAIAGPASAIAGGNPTGALNSLYSLPSTIGTLAPLAGDAASAAGMAGLGATLGELGANIGAMATPIGIAALPIALTRAVSGFVDSQAKARNKQHYAETAAQRFGEQWPTLTGAHQLWEDIQSGTGDVNDWLSRSESALGALPGVRSAEQNAEFREYGLKDNADKVTGAIPYLGTEAYLSRLKALDAAQGAGMSGLDAPSLEQVLGDLSQWGGVDNYTADLERSTLNQPAPIAYDPMNPTADTTPWDTPELTSFADLPQELKDAYQPGHYYDTALSALGYFGAGDPTGAFTDTPVGGVLGDQGLAGLMGQPYGAATPKTLRPKPGDPVSLLYSPWNDAP